MGLFDIADSMLGSVCDVVSETASFAEKAVSGVTEFAGDTVRYAGNAVCDATEKGINLVSGTIDVIDRPVSRTAALADNYIHLVPEILKCLNPGLGPVTSLRDSFIDNVFRASVTPVYGSVLYVDLACGYAEHSGIYVGGGEKCIVELTNEGG